MVLIAEGRDGEIDRRHAILLRLGFRVFDGPARVAVLLSELRGLVLPVLGMRPSRSACFSSCVLRCFGAATIVASTIWPLIARKPEARKSSSKRRNKTSTAPAR